MKILNKIGQGNRGVVYKAIFNKQIVAIKYAKPHIIDKEWQILSILKGHYAPYPIYKDKDFIVMEYIDGIPLKDITKPQYYEVIKLSLKGAYYLDTINITHNQLGRFYHILYYQNNIKFIDFERSSNGKRNILQIIGYYLMRDSNFDKNKLLKIVKEYKSNPKNGLDLLINEINQLKLF